MELHHQIRHEQNTCVHLWNLCSVVYSTYSSSIHIYFYIIVTNKKHTTDICIVGAQKVSFSVTIDANIICQKLRQIERKCSFLCSAYIYISQCPNTIVLSDCSWENCTRKLIFNNCRERTRQGEQEDHHGRLKVHLVFSRAVLPALLFKWGKILSEISQMSSATWRFQGIRAPDWLI